MRPSFPGSRGIAGRIVVATGDPELNHELVRLLAEHSPDASAVGGVQLVEEVSRRPSLQLLIIGETGPDSTALDLLQAVREHRPDLAVLLFSTRPTIEHATESIRRGVEDFIPIPYSAEVVRKEVARILEAADLHDRLQRLDQTVSQRFGFERLVSGSRRMHAVFDRARAAAQSDTPVLIVGETGTGKELLARAIHTNGRRSKRPFVPVNCAALPHDLVESELFGHRRGAFSGASTDHPGLFGAAHGGTLFLDEIGELPLDTQAKLLRVLQDGEVRPVGGLESRTVDVRIIAATNRTLLAMRDGGMRQDLFFRLSVLVIEIPPLRDRREDLPLLIAHFLAAIRERNGRRVDGIDPAALELLAAYRFPGNVRELENMLESISLALPADRSTIRVDDFRAWQRRCGAAGAERPLDTGGMPLKLADLEAWAIGEALRRACGNKSVAATLLGISRDTLYRKLHELNLSDSLT
ncbi:MAG: sigma-54 interaction domain-containing protein [Betaproteobacteria bacterium]